MATHPTVKQGSKGPEVKKAQKALSDRGYNPGAQDGLFGGQTKNAVTTYQADRAQNAHLPLVADGIVGPKTWARLDPDTIKKGAKGEAVKLLQEHLNWYDAVIQHVAVDGDFGAATEASVKQFQTWWGTLTADGVVGPLTWIALWS